MIAPTELLNNVVIHDAEQQQWLHFRDPRRIVIARSISEVMPALQAVEEEVFRNNLSAAGFIAYEAAPAFDAALRVRQDTAFPLLWFGLYAHAEPLRLPPAIDANQEAPRSWSPSVTRAAYENAIKRIKEYIQAGDTYQVNYTFRLRAPFTGDAWPYFLELAQAQDASYGGFVNTDNWAICSASPELFFRLDGTQLISRPMKGTAPRGLSLSDDLQQRDWLHHSKKNQAENIMIVDMVRNDLGRIANIGSVQVSDLYTVEKYPTLWQMTSTVSSETTAGLCTIMQALFPPASITGAPKPRTMEIIAELESTPRRIYTGSIGFMTPDRRAQFNVAIRTVLIDKVKREAEYGVGGGIVWDSLDKMEFEECRTKAKIITETVPTFSLLETILWTPGDGYFLLPYHLTRLKDSAAYFSFSVAMDAIEQSLAALAKTFPLTNQKAGQKVRLLVAKDGGITCEAETLEHTPPDHVPHVCLARLPIDTANPFLYHKTTNRGIYDQALTTCPGYADVILWNAKGEITESSIANIVVELDGCLYTPPVECGLLPGTYRAYLLEQGRVNERIITKEDLLRSSHVYLVNSVRKEREVMVDGE